MWAGLSVVAWVGLDWVWLGDILSEMFGRDGDGRRGEVSNARIRGSDDCWDLEGSAALLCTRKSSDKQVH